MKRTLAVFSKSLLALALTSALVACGGGGSGSGNGGGGDGGELPPGGGNPGGDISSPEPGDNSSPNPGGDGDTSPKVAAVEWGKSMLMTPDGVKADDPTIAVSAEGDVAAAWVQDGYYANTVWARHYDSETGKWGEAQQIDKGGVALATYHNRSNPQITFVGEVAVVVWDQGEVVYGSIHDGNGWSSNPQVIDGRDFEYQAIGVSVAAALDGSSAVVTYELREQGAKPVVRASEFSLVTGLWSAPVTLGRVDVTPDYGIQMATDPVSGEIHVVWSGKDAEVFSLVDLITTTYKDGVWSAPEVIATTQVESMVAQPDPASDQPIVVWTRGGFNEVVYARYIDGSWQSESVGATGYKHVDITSAAMADGDILVSYEYLGSGNMKQVASQRLDVQTGEWSAPLVHDKFQTRRPSLAADGNGRAVLAYDQYNTWAVDYTEADGWSSRYQPMGLNSGRDNKVVMNNAGAAAIIYKSSGNASVGVQLGR